MKNINQVWEQVRNQVWDQVSDQVIGRVRNQVTDQLWDQVRALRARPATERDALQTRDCVVEQPNP